MQDHLEVYIQQKCLQPITLYSIENSIFYKIQVGLQWFWNQTGVASTNQMDAGGFIRLSEILEQPNV